MRFAFQFDRRVGAGVPPLLGSDSAPTVAADLLGTNVFQTKVASTGVTQRMAIGYQYVGAGPAPDLDVQGYIYDGTSETWFTVDSLGVTVQAGDVAFLPLMQLVDTPQVSGGDPYVSLMDSIEFALVVTPAGGDPDGIYSFMMSTDVGAMEDEAAAAAPLPVGAATEATLSSIDTKLVDPLPVTAALPIGAATEATLASIDAKITNPLPVSIGGGSSVEVEGIDTDDAAVTAKPILIGGKHIADPAADTVDDGDAAYLLVTDQRRLAVESRAYDSPTAAERVVPVTGELDRWVPVPMSDSLGADGSVVTYMDMRGFHEWSLQFIPTNVAGSVITVTVGYTNEDVDDVTAATYTDVTNDLFSTVGVTAEKLMEPPDTTRVTIIRVTTTLTGWASGTPSWVLEGKKQ